MEGKKEKEEEVEKKKLFVVCVDGLDGGKGLEWTGVCVTWRKMAGLSVDRWKIERKHEVWPISSKNGFIAGTCALKIL